MLRKFLAILFLFSCLSSTGLAVDTARVTIRTGETAPAISEYLLGKFTEHLGQNVYQGLWAQMVRNPEFVPADRWPGQTALRNRLDRHEQEFGFSNLLITYQSGFAPFWSPFGGVEGTLHQEGITDYQRLQIPVDGGGVRTGMYAPFYRTPRMEFSVKARASRPCSLSVAIQSLGGQGVTDTLIALSTEWQTIGGMLTSQLDYTPWRETPFRVELHITDSATVDLARFLIFPGDHINGWEAEAVEAIRQAGIRMIRFPGGNFVSGYHWKDGVGPLDERPVIPNPHWNMVEWNHVGTDEWLRLCQLVDAEPLICLNAGNGTAAEASDWVEYCNTGPQTEYGAERVSNGHPEPYHVRYWEIGNELYGGWQIGNTDASGNAVRFNNFVDQMEAVDPNIYAIGCGSPWNRNWNETLVNYNTKLIDGVAIHTLVGGQIPNTADPKTVYRELMAYADGYQGVLENLVGEPMRNAGLTPSAAITEIQIFTRKDGLPNNQNLSEAIWYGRILHSAIRSGIVEFITHSALMNHGGSLRKDQGIIYRDPVWWAHQLYGTHAGRIPVAVDLESSTFSTGGEYLEARSDVPYLDVLGLMNTAGDSLTVFIVNSHPEEAMQTELNLQGFLPKAEVMKQALTGAGFLSGNSVEQPHNVTLDTTVAEWSGETNVGLYPPHSLTRLAFTRKSTGRTKEGSSPQSYQLRHNFPNPFNSTTTIEFSLPKRSFVDLDILSVDGRVVRSLVGREMGPGHYQVQWRGRNEENGAVSSGMYLCRLRSNGITLNRKLILVQ